MISCYLAISGQSPLTWDPPALACLFTKPCVYNIRLLCEVELNWGWCVSFEPYFLVSIAPTEGCLISQSCSLIFSWTAFCFDYVEHLGWHCINFPPRVAFIFVPDFVLMTGETNHSFSLFQHIPKTLTGLKSGLCGGHLMCENDS